MKKKNKSKRGIFDKFTLFWKIYLFLFVFIYLTGHISLFEQLRMIGFIDLVISLPSLVALYGLGFKKRLFVNFYWKSYFYFFVAWYFVLNFWILPTTLSLFEELVAAVGIGIVYIALYLYAFKFIRK